MKKLLTKNPLSILITLLLAASILYGQRTIPRTLYTINGSAETISKINLNDLTITKDIVTTGQIPNRIRVHNNLLYIVSSGDDNIKVVDTADDTKILKIIGLDAGDNPWDIEFADNGNAYVTNFNTNSVSVIDLNSGTVTKKIDVGQGPQGILYTNGKLYVSNTGYVGWGEPFASPSVSVIDVATNQVINTVSTPINAQDLALAPNGKLYVVCTGNYSTIFGKIAIIDISGTATLVDSIIIGGSPGDIEITNDGFGYTSAWGDGTNGFLYKFDTNADTVMRSSDNPINVGPNLSGLYWDNRENQLWIPYMTAWGADGFVQQFNVTADSVIWVSNVLGNGTSAIAIVEEYVVSVENDVVVKEFSLEQNYPNPFNPTTKIKFSVPEAGLYALKVFNVLGQEVATIVNQDFIAGKYSFNFDASNFTSGIYFYKLIGNKVDITKKMMLVK